MAGNEDETLSEPIEPIEPIDFDDEPVAEADDEPEEPPKRSSRRGRRGGRGRSGGDDADESKTARRGRRDSMDRVTRFEPKKFSMRFLLAAIGALAIMGVQIGLMKEFALAEWASRGTMGWVLGAGVPAGIAIFCGIFGGLMAPRSYIKAFIVGAAVPAITGIVLGALPEGQLPVEEPVEAVAAAEGEGEDAPAPVDAPPAPVRALLTAVNTRFLATKADLDALKAEVEAAAASKTDAETKAADLAGKVGELEKAKEQSEGDIAKLKTDVDGEKERADSAEQKVAGLEAKAKELQRSSDAARDELKAAQRKVADGVKALADLQKKLDEAAAAGGEGVDPHIKVIEQLKLKVAQQEEKNRTLVKDLADAEEKIPSTPRKPGWMSGAEFRKLFKLSERSQQRVLRLLK